MLLTVLLVGTAIWAMVLLRGSLPALDGSIPLSGLRAPVTIQRDALGVPTITATDLADLYRGLGFLHGQERFFKMDLMRRQAAGELSEILGDVTVEVDRRNRMLRLRAAARNCLERTDPETRTLLQAYTEGVNSGLEEFDSPPLEYLLMRVDPAPWKPEDVYLVVFAMFLTLNDVEGEIDHNMGVMRDTLPPELVAFLTPHGSELDAPITGKPFELPPIPGPDVIDLRGLPAPADVAEIRRDDVMAGSNGWAVSGALTAYTAGMVANDMHLRHDMPHIWYRADMIWSEDGESMRATGVTLPGAPGLVAGSNGYVAWGFTNTYGDWTDVVRLIPDPDDRNRYLTADGSEPYQVFRETVLVRGAEPVELDVRWTRWGPVVNRDPSGRDEAALWVGHSPEAVNLGSVSIMTARSLEEAVDFANRTGIPAQNLNVADRDGNVGWSIAGRIPLRTGYDSRFPVESDQGPFWTGWLPPDETPQIVNPEEGRIWTANARVVDGPAYELIGTSGHADGGRAAQIRDRLREREQFSEEDMLTIQLDDEARYYRRWADLMTTTLSEHPETVERRELLEILENWHGHASVDSVAFHMVFEFRNRVHAVVLAALTGRCRELDDEFQMRRFQGLESPVWALVTERPPHLTPPGHTDWPSFLDAQIDEVLNDTEEFGPLSDRTWGRFNTARINHPMSGSIPLLGRYLSMPPRELPGDKNTPRVQSPSFGASQRFVVSPGHEENGIFHMPGGQASHPLAPYFGTGHQDWEEGHATPFLPGPAQWTLELTP